MLRIVASPVMRSVLRICRPRPEPSRRWLCSSFGARGGSTIQNKETVLDEVDAALGVHRPPDLEVLLTDHLDPRGVKSCWIPSARPLRGESAPRGVAAAALMASSSAWSRDLRQVRQVREVWQVRHVRQVR